MHPPEAIPLRNIKVKTIIKVLPILFLLLWVFLKQLSQIRDPMLFSFTSESYASIKLNIKQFQSNAYHPESQGAVERFHQTLTNIRNTFCLDSQQDRDDGVHMLLFAAMEAFHESLRCSPFELVFGHSVEGLI